MFRVNAALLSIRGPVRNVLSVPEIDGMQALHFSGRIKIITDADESDPSFLRQLLGLNALNKTKPVLGFDTESKPSAMFSQSRNPTALIQLASESACVMWRTVGAERRRMPEFVRNILSDPNIIKVGQGISSDTRSLAEDFDNIADTSFQGLVDLYTIGTRLKCQPRSLQGMVGIFLRRRLLKDMQVSDWEAPVMRAEQVQYAALDAWASRAVFLEMQRVYGDDVINEMGMVTSMDTKLDKPRIDRVTVTPNTLVTPNVDKLTVSQSSSPQIDLVKFCVKQGFTLKLGEFEKDEETNKYKCSFHVSRGDDSSVITGCSQELHASIRDAQADAARHTLAQLVS